MPTIWTILPFEGPPKPTQFDSVDEALTAYATHLKRRSAAAHKERVDLDLLHAHSGQRFAQHVLIPDQLHATLRALDGVAPIVLLPPAAGAATIATLAGLRTCRQMQEGGCASPCFVRTSHAICNLWAISV